MWYLIVSIPDLCTLTYLDLFIMNGMVSFKIGDKRDDHTFEIVNFPYFEGDFSRFPTYGVYILQLIGVARI